jgi:SulP family sulfate permease
VILSVLHFLRRMSETVETQPVAAQDLTDALAGLGLTSLPPQVLVYEISGPMFFGAVENFERALEQTHTDPKALVIRLADVPFMDITGIQTLDAVARKLGARGVRVVLCEANGRVRGKLVRAGVIGEDSRVHHTDTLTGALRVAQG